MRALGTLLLLSCGLRSAVPPGGLVCDRFTVASDALDTALAEAKPNDCVILTTGTYVGAFVLPIDVSLAGANGAEVVLKGNGGGDPVLTVRGGKRSTVRGLKVDTSAGDGIAIDPGPANLVGVVVSGTSTNAALTSTCTRGTCEEVTVEDCELTTSTTGVLASGGIVRVVRGRIAEMGGTGLSDGSGVVASRGAVVRLEGVTVEANKQLGVLADGAGTTVTLEQAVVRGNLERGIWVQNVTDGGVSLSGGEVSANRLMGLGVRDSSGVTLSGVTVKDTLAVEVPVGIGPRELVGDGVGLFAGARDVVLDAVTASGNARAQIIADAAGSGVKVTAPQVSGGLYRVIVQRGAVIDVPAALVDDAGRELATKSDPVPVSQ